MNERPRMVCVLWTRKGVNRMRMGCHRQAIALARLCNINEPILLHQNLDPVDLKANVTTLWMGEDGKDVENYC